MPRCATAPARGSPLPHQTTRICRTTRPATRTPPTSPRPTSKDPPMTTGTGRHDTTQKSREHINALRAAKVEQARRKRLWVRLASLGATVAVIGVIVAMMLTSRQQSSSVMRVAPDFTLTDTSGTTVSLAALRGKNVLLYFSEGAGCQGHRCPGGV